MRDAGEQIEQPVSFYQRLLDQIDSKEAIVAIIGLGYVGLPLALEFVRAGFKVAAYDYNEEKIASLLASKSYIQDIPDSAIVDAMATTRFHPTSSSVYLYQADAIIICVPTPVNARKTPDLRYMNEAFRQVAEKLQKGTLVVIGSTTFPGHTYAFGEVLDNNGFQVGKDAFLAFAPERVDPGNKHWSFSAVPKVVGGVTDQCTSLAFSLFNKIFNVVLAVKDSTHAEMVKLLENSFRQVNIGFINEFAIMCNKLNVNVWEIIDAAATKPYGFMPFYPGPGPGGHCIPVDPLYLSWAIRSQDHTAEFIELAHKINTAMPERVVDLCVYILNEFGESLRGSNILLLGLSYKPGSSDTRESPAVEVLHRLRANGASVRYHDPHVPTFTSEGLTLTSVDLESVDMYDLVVVLTAHPTVNHSAVAQKARAVFDTRNACKWVSERENIYTL